MLFMKEKRWLYAFIQIKNLWGFVALWILKCEPLSNGSKLIFTLVSDKSSLMYSKCQFLEDTTQAEKI